MGPNKNKQNKNCARKSISWEFFSIIAAVLLLGLFAMCVMQTGLSAAYFSAERRTALSAILDGATAMGDRLAEQGITITTPAEADEERQSAQKALNVFDTATHALLFAADTTGQVVVYTGGASAFTGEAVPEAVLNKLDAGGDVFFRNNLGGVYTARYYTVGRAVCFGGEQGYLFASSAVEGLSGYVGDMLGMFILSAGLMLLVSSLLSLLFARRLTTPIEEISNAARQLGSGDFTARAPVSGCDELAELANTFNHMAGRLQTIDNSRGQFMGNIAHELRTPMTSIKGFIDGMLDGTIPPAEQHRYLEIVSQETGRLARLVQNMLDITKLEAGEYRVQARNYDLWNTVTDVVLADEKRIEDGKIDIEGLAPDRALVFADPDLVHQVVYNIVDNAIKFTPPGGVIRFAATPDDGGMVRLSVENTGAGISPEALPYVFERFYKEDRSRGLNTRGSGLGLHICKVLIQLSGGQVRVESEEGQWCRFSFTLPAAGNDLPPPPEGRRLGGN
ncbi:MAG: HAMP domain-containing sensor histidine kinase [Gemmiger sp.]|nr:HAMP domain-containing sensor histidine kinase [Gemmiger sp.]